MSEDVKKAAWWDSRRKAWSGFTGLTNRMVDSSAFRALRSAHSVKVLIYFWRMAEYPRRKRKPGEDSPIGNLKKILNWDNLSFEYRIAGYLGMRPDQFVRALRELFKYGFIDILHHGRGIKGDWTRYAYSDRWKMYGTPQWIELPFPFAVHVGWRAKGRRYYTNAELPTTQSRSYQVVKTGDDYGNAELKTPISTDPSTTDFSSPSRFSMPSTPLTGDGRIRKTVQGKGKSNSGQSRRITKPKVLPWMGTAAERAELLATWGPM